MALVDPFIQPLPPKIANDPELAPWFQYLSKFCHDLWVRTGSGTDSIADAAQTTGDTFTGDINLSASVLKVDGTQVITAQQAAVADASAATATNPAAPTAYTAHSSGAVAVTSNAATDLDTTAAALQTLVSEVTTYEIAISALIVDVASIRTQLNAALQELRDHGIIAT